jgi:predicted nucleic acid-binding protein
VRSHAAHSRVRRGTEGRLLCLTSHSLLETYSVLTRLPGGMRFSAAEARRLIDEHFARIVTTPAQVAATAHAILAESGISGGAVYDAIVALAARHAGLALLTRDARAIPTYVALGARVEMLGP